MREDLLDRMIDAMMPDNVVIGMVPREPADHVDEFLVVCRQSFGHHGEALALDVAIETVSRPDYYPVAVGFWTDQITARHMDTGREVEGIGIMAVICRDLAFAEFSSVDVHYQSVTSQGRLIETLAPVLFPMPESVMA